jgi:hypothetical protein
VAKWWMMGVAKWWRMGVAKGGVGVAKLWGDGCD